MPDVEIVVHVKGLVWFVRRYGARTGFRYWREGRRRGWMTRDEALQLIEDLGHPTAKDDHGRP